MRAAGDLADGIYFVGSGDSVIVDLDDDRGPASTQFEAETFQTKAAEYGMPEADLYKGFGALGLQRR